MFFEIQKKKFLVGFEISRSIKMAEVQLIAFNGFFYVSFFP